MYDQKTSSHEKSTRRDPKLEAADVVTTADGLKVYCAFTKFMPVADLKPHPKNWNEHPHFGPQPVDLLAIDLSARIDIPDDAQTRLL